MIKRRLAAALLCLLCLLAAGCTIGISNNPQPPDRCAPSGRGC